MNRETTPGLVFGPVPSRRLGRSLGVNNIPPKVCSYSCIYCQLGSTVDQTIERQTFYHPVEYLTEFEGTAFVPSGPVAQDLLDITAVHPMREEAVRALLDRAGAAWSVIQELLAQGQLVQTEYQGQQFYLRRFSSHKT